MMKIAGQSKPWVRAPPRRTPAAAADAAHRGPEAEGAVAFGALLEGAGDDREAGGGDHRGAEALDRAGADQDALAVGERAAERGGGEEADADQEDLAAGEEVGGAPGQHQEAGEGERVGVDHPLQAGVGEAERLVDLRQRDVDDRDVEDDHELREADGQQQGVFLEALHSSMVTVPQSSMIVVSCGHEL